MAGKTFVCSGGISRSHGYISHQLRDKTKNLAREQWLAPGNTRTANSDSLDDFFLTPRQEKREPIIGYSMDCYLSLFFSSNRTAMLFFLSRSEIVFIYRKTKENFSEVKQENASFFHVSFYGALPHTILYFALKIKQDKYHRAFPPIFIPPKKKKKSQRDPGGLTRVIKVDFKKIHLI